MRRDGDVGRGETRNAVQHSTEERGEEKRVAERINGAA